MKSTAIVNIMFVFMIFFLIFADLSMAQNSTKVLVFIMESSETGSNATLNVTVGGAGPSKVNNEFLETQVAKGLLQSGYKVMTSQEIAVDGSMGKRDIAQAVSGNIPALRKVAAVSDADVLLYGHVQVRESEKKVLDMDMITVSSSVSYRVVDVLSGEKRVIDNKTFTGNSMNKGQGRNAVFKKMGHHLADTVMKTIPASRTKEIGNRLAAYGKKVSRPSVNRVSQVKKTKSPAKKVQQNGSAPQIIIIQPVINRGFNVVHIRKSITIQGFAYDKVGIQEISINNNLLSLNAENQFNFVAPLELGNNTIAILAVNNAGKSTTKKIQVNFEQDDTPPEIILEKPDVGRGFKIVKKTYQKEELFEGFIKDAGGVKAFSINGNPVALNKNGHFAKLISIETEEVLLSAVDLAGNKTMKKIHLTEAAREENKYTAKPLTLPSLWGVSIGVSKYKSSSVDLKYADQDAISISQFFKKQKNKLFSEVHFKTLINQEVTRDSVINSMSTHLGQAGPDDVIFIFMAGHGIKHEQTGSYYFIPSDTDFDSVLSKGLRMSDFNEAILILSQNVGKVIVAMDTCHSGALNIAGRSFGGGQDLSAVLKESSGTFVLAAAKGGEQSLEDTRFQLQDGKKGHGVFTYALIKGLSGAANFDKNNYISVNELFQYVAKQVPRLTQGKQHPYFRGQGTDIPIAKTAP